MQSQQIRGVLPRTVTSVSSRYPQLLCVLSRFQKVFARHARAKAPTAVFKREDPGIQLQARWTAGSSRATTLCKVITRPAASAGLTILQRGGAFCIDPEQA
jgi:hypothetical protein